MTMDDFRALPRAWDTREAEIVRTAERQLNGQLSRGEDAYFGQSEHSYRLIVNRPFFEM